MNTKVNYLKKYLQEGGDMPEMQAQQPQENPQEQLVAMIQQYMQQPDENLGNEIIGMVAEMLGIGMEQPQPQMVESQKHGGMIPYFQKGGSIRKYQTGTRGLQNIKGVGYTQKKPLPNKRTLTETYQGQRMDSSAGSSPYTMSGKGQSAGTQQAYNKQIDTEDFSKYGSTADEIAKYASTDKVKAQLATQSLMNKLSQDAVKTGKLRPGQSVQMGGFTLSMDNDGVVTGDRSALNKNIGLDENLRYRTGQFGSEETQKQGGGIVQKVKVPYRITVRFDSGIEILEAELNTAVDTKTGQIVPSVVNTGEGNVSQMIKADSVMLEMPMPGFENKQDFFKKKGAVLRKMAEAWLITTPEFKQSVAAVVSSLRDKYDNKK